jgi:hypothetical protein
LDLTGVRDCVGIENQGRTGRDQNKKLPLENQPHSGLYPSTTLSSPSFSNVPNAQDTLNKNVLIASKNQLM